MNITHIGARLILLTVVLHAQQPNSPTKEFTLARPGQTPVYRIKLRVHNGRSSLLVEELRTTLEEMNFIWWSQAGVCFEITSTRDDVASRDGFDIWFLPAVPDPVGVNGVYKGDHDIWSRDYPNLRTAVDPVTYRAARTSAHELGHGLTLPHHNDGDGAAENLMASGTLGWHLDDFQVRTARARASRMATPETSFAACGPPEVH